MSDYKRAPVKVTRRNFLKLSVITAVAAGAGLAGCQANNTAHPLEQAPAPPVQPLSVAYPEVPPSPTQPPPTALVSFTPAEGRLVDALTSRIMPGSADDPGAHEAGVTNYIDKKLTYHDGVVEPTYSSGPYAVAYEGDTPPPNKDPNKVYVKKTELPRYGSQGSQTPKQAYRAGLQAVDRYAGSKFGKKFVELSPDQQDQIVDDMATGKATGFDKPTAPGFFQMVRSDVIDGFFSDPAYGGNQDMVGWKLIGYPGAQRAYTPEEMSDEAHIRPPQSLAMLPDFHPGQPVNPDVVLPVSGSNPTQATPQTP